jgi:hypothetical protein
MRYKVGWFIPQQIIALTHFVSEVTQDDFNGIVDASNACLLEASQPFNMIIDNRIIKNEQVVSLEVILQSMPQLQNLPLRQVIMILPRAIGHKAAVMEVQRMGDVQLRFVDGLTAAFATLRATDASLNWDLQISGFFVEDIT